MNYTTIETDIVTRLAPLVTAGYEVEAMPDNEASNLPPRQRGRVTVQVGMSKFGEHRSITAAVVQEEDIYVDIILRARTLRATGGIYDLCELARRLLIGYTPQNCRLPLSGVDFGGITPAELQDSIWTYSLRLKTQTISVGAADEDVTPLITAITFDDQTTSAPPPSAELFASAYQVAASGDSVILAWITSGGDEVSISGIGVVDAIGSTTVSVTGDVTYTLTLTQGVTVLTQSVTLGITPADAQYTLVNTATPPDTLESGSIEVGDSETIVAPPVTVLRDGQPYAVVPSNETIDVPSDVPSCAAADYVLDDEDGNEIESGTIASGASKTIVAPDGTVNITNTDSDPIASVTVASGGVETYTIPNVSWTDSDGSAESTPYGDTIVCTPQVQSLTIEIQIADATDTAGPFTITANSAGTISTVNDGGLTNLVIEVNGTPDTAPFTLAVGDTIEFTYDTTVAATVITLTGTY